MIKDDVGLSALMDELCQRGNERPRKVRLVADEHVPISLVNDLKSGHVDVKTSSEFGAVGRSDCELFDMAKQSGRVLLTLDKHFWSHRAFRPEVGGGIIFLDRCGNDVRRMSIAFGRLWTPFGKNLGGQWYTGMRVRACPDRFVLRYRDRDRGRRILCEAIPFRGQLNYRLLYPGGNN